MSLPSHSLRSNKRITLIFPTVKINTGTMTFHSRASSIWNIFRLSVRSATSITIPGNVLKCISLWHGLSPIDTSMPDGPLMLRNCFIYIAVEHSAVAPLSLATPGILVLQKFDWLVGWLIGEKFEVSELFFLIEAYSGHSVYSLHLINRFTRRTSGVGLPFWKVARKKVNIRELTGVLNKSNVSFRNRLD